MSNNIKVAVKVRPLISREIEDNLCYQWRIYNNTLWQIDQNGRDVGPHFTFDKVYGEDTETIEIYNEIAKPIVQAALSGINGTIFAYGQTSSGKTFTMMGTEDSPGINQLVALDLFNSIKNMDNRDFLLRVSYIEIYNDQIKDLLNIESSRKIKIHATHEHIKVDVTEKVTTTAAEVLNVIREGQLNRHIGVTNMNEASSRSHTIIQITIESREHSVVGDEVGPVNISQLNLVDLAGSERAGQTGATVDRFKERTHINKSLSSLALVIKQLSENKRHTNYRDSKLTHILQNSLGGNAKTSIICTVTPAALDETISTLQFANCAKAIKNNPEVNAIVSDVSMIQMLSRKLTQLQTQLETKKKIEDDLKAKIDLFKGQIIYGFERTRDLSGKNRRKTWCAPPSLPFEIPSVEVELPQFCTSGLKKNPLVPSSSNPIQGAETVTQIPWVSEEQCTLPGDRTAHFDDEIIEINSDNDKLASPVTYGVCSPYHQCHGSKTPPCALRDRAGKAEEKVKSIVILTEREKICPQTVIELESHCEALKTILTDMEVPYEALNQKAKIREEDLLFVLEDQQAVQNESNGEETMSLEMDLPNFMKLSKVSLVNSDHETTIVAQKNDLREVREVLQTDLQIQINTENEMIKKLEAELTVSKDKISQLETENGDIKTNSSFKEESDIKIVVSPCKDTNVCEGCQDKEDLKSDLQKLSQKLIELKAQKADVEDKFNNSSNFTKDFGTVDAQSMSKLASIPESLDYSMDKTDCLTFFLEKTGANKENFQHELKIIDIMTMLYNSFKKIHANEIQNLTNKLRHYEETINALETQRYNKCKDCYRLQLIMKTFQNTMQLQDNIITMLQKQKENDAVSIKENEAHISELEKVVEKLRQTLHQM